MVQEICINRFFPAFSSILYDFFVEGDFGPLAEALWLLDVMTLLIDSPSEGMISVTKYFDRHLFFTRRVPLAVHKSAFQLFFGEPR